MALDLSRSFAERVIREPEDGRLRDGAIRYLMMRPDALMGMFGRMRKETRQEALEALASSIAEFGGRSVRAYFESGAASPEALIQTVIETSAHLGWGVWRFESTEDGKAMEVFVRNSPFAEAAGELGSPACAAILGLLSACAPYLLSGGAQVRETCCSSESGQGICRFRISSPNGKTGGGNLRATPKNAVQELHPQPAGEAT